MFAQAPAVWPASTRRVTGGAWMRAQRVRNTRVYTKKIDVQYTIGVLANFFLEWVPPRPRAAATVPPPARRGGPGSGVGPWARPKSAQYPCLRTKTTLTIHQKGSCKVVLLTHVTMTRRGHLRGRPPLGRCMQRRCQAAGHSE